MFAVNAHFKNDARRDRVHNDENRTIIAIGENDFCKSRTMHKESRKVYERGERS